VNSFVYHAVDIMHIENERIYLTDICISQKYGNVKKAIITHLVIEGWYIYSLDSM